MVMTSWCDSESSECECLVGGVVPGLFLLKTSLEVVCSSGSVGDWVIIVGVFLFCAKDSLGRLASTLIFLMSSASSALLLLESIFSAKKRIND